MTEKEYLLEMLCCLPKELLEKRIKGQREMRGYWLNEIDVEIIKQALLVYDEPMYKGIRERQM